MKILILFFFAVFGSLVYFNRKYSNPNKLIFIFGKKGAGKSTYMLYLMLRHLKQGWNVYTNMEDVKLDGVRIMDVASLKTCTPESHSVLFIDEAGLIWDNRNFKSFDSGYTEFFKLQRKYGCKMYVNSQAFDIDKKLRDLTDSMVLMSCLFGCIGIVRPIIRKVALVEASAQGDSRIADNLKFGSLFSFKFLWLPKYFKYFDSFSAPERPPVSYRTIQSDLRVARARSPLQALKLTERVDEDEDD